MCMLAFFAITTSFATDFNYYYDGYWGEWYNAYGVCLKGDFSGFICYWYHNGDGSLRDHPSQWFLKIQIKDYIEPSQVIKDAHLKDKTWYEYTGTVEYYISDEYQDIKSVLKSALNPIQHFVRPSKHRVEKGETPCVKKTAQATIKIAPYKDNPKDYNIWFDGVGIGISIKDTDFKK